MSKVYVGMDVHKESVVMAVLREGAKEPEWVRRFPHDHRKLKKVLARLGREDEVQACYEASGAGYVLERVMRSWGHRCEIVAPSLIRKQAGDRRKHDKKDAAELARQYRAGDLTTIRIPTETEERVRDLVRCRETIQREALKSRHYVLKFLARRGLVYREGSHWSQKHWAWLRSLRNDAVLEAEDQIVFTEYLALLEYKLGRRDELDRRIEALALSPAYRDAVGRLCSLRGVSTHAAMVLITEIVDFRRFDHPGKLMAYLGLIPGEDSSGLRKRGGPITKAGNRRCRHVLVQAAWSNRYPPRVGPSLKRRQEGQPPDVIAHSWKAQHRLHKLFRRLAYKKSSQIAVVAVARELVGFVWAIMQDLEPASQTLLDAA